jgi:hypothetical protein
MKSSTLYVGMTNAEPIAFYEAANSSCLEVESIQPNCQ